MCVYVLRVQDIKLYHLDLYYHYHNHDNNVYYRGLSTLSTARSRASGVYPPVNIDRVLLLHIPLESSSTTLAEDHHTTSSM